MDAHQIRRVLGALRAARTRSAADLGAVAATVEKLGRQMLRQAEPARSMGADPSIEIYANITAIRAALGDLSRGIDIAIETEIAAIDSHLARPEHSLGATPYRGEDRRPYEIGGNDPYRHSREYADFDDFVAAQAAELDVILIDRQDATGLWEGSGEPATDLRVRGDRAAVEELSRRICDRYNQDAVMVVTIDPTARTPGGATRSRTTIRAAARSGRSPPFGRPDSVAPASWKGVWRSWSRRHSLRRRSNSSNG